MMRSLTIRYATCLRWLPVLCCFLAFGFTATAQNARTPKAVFIIVDGIPADVIEKLQTPVLQEIARKGGYTRAMVGGGKGTYTQTPTISAVGYNSVLTGTWVNKHNVWGNDIKAPNYAYYTLFRYFKEQRPTGKTAIYSTWLDNRTKLVGDQLAATGNIAIDHHYDGMELDTVNFPHDKKSQYLDRIDDSVSHHAAAHIRQEAPDLSWVYLEYTDDMGHAHGDSPEFTAAIREADKRIGYIWEAIRYREKQFNEEWMIVVTTDHGRDARTGKGHGGQSDRERSGWIFTNASHLNQEFDSARASIVDILPSIARFLQLHLPVSRAREIDGTPFIGPLSFRDASFSYAPGSVTITWTPVAKKESLKVWMAASNDFKTGGTDVYQLLQSVDLKAGKAVIPVDEKGFFKIVLEGAHNSANSWHLPGK